MSTLPPSDPNHPTLTAPQGSPGGYPAPEQVAYRPPPQALYPAPGQALPGAPVPPGSPGAWPAWFDGATSPDDLTRPLYDASFGEAIKRFFRSYARFSGRASRSEYWWVQLFLTLVYLVPVTMYMIGFVTVLDGSLSRSLRYSTEGSGSGLSGPAAVTTPGPWLLLTGAGLLVLIAMSILVPQIALGWRRLHDGNFPGPLWFLSCIPYLGPVVLVVFMLLPPQPAGRRFDLPASRPGTGS